MKTPPDLKCDPTDSGTHLSDVWTDAQRSRSALFKSLVLKAWRQLFRNVAAGSDQPGSKARRYLRA